MRNPKQAFKVVNIGIQNFGLGEVKKTKNPGTKNFLVRGLKKVRANYLRDFIRDNIRDIIRNNGIIIKALKVISSNHLRCLDQVTKSDLIKPLKVICSKHLKVLVQSPKRDVIKNKKIVI